MNTISIRKFELGRNYHTYETDLFLFHLEKRDGKELQFRVVHRDDKITYAAGTAKVTADAKGVRETVRVSGPDGNYNLDALLTVPIGKRYSELPSEEQDRIDAAIAQDLRQRKNI